ncbi:SAG family member [Eimeria maxima]|uniref:SAG family member n=1 Tax=Eimeria maxima TaxID=5804 RepID=U6M143_EIMMA|nr:SAG family member [Eimeria maxima]CDJ57952.1 SAG family member [Eimeria maxima]
MAALRSLAFLGASVLALGKANGVETINYTVKLEKVGECLTDINTARDAVGFISFVQVGVDEEGKSLPDAVASTAETNFKTSAWKPVCDSLLGKSSTDAPGASASTPAKFPSGTYAFKALESNSPTCSDIVGEWKAAYKNFKGLPPPNKDTKLYDDRNNVSFVAVYNPSPDATADCRVVTCIKETTNTELQPQTKNTEAGYALICMTTPDVLPQNSTAPFTDEQWAKITKALGGSASAAVPGLLGFATALFGLALSLF